MPVSGIDRVMLRARLPGAAMLLVALACGTCTSPSPPRKSPSAPLTVAGAEYLEPLLRAEILAFRDRYPDSDSIRVVANCECNSDDVLAVVAGPCDFAREDDPGSR